MAEQVVGQPTPQDAARAGAGSEAPQAAPNPWAEYGLNPDGSAIVAKPVTPDPEKSALENKVAQLEAQLAKIPEGFEALSKKVGLVDRLVNALKGEDAQPADKGNFKEIWSDLKKVSENQAPGVAKLLNLLEADPNFLDKFTASQNALMASHVVGINSQAHDRVLDLAKKAGFKAGTDGELSEMVFPFEQSMTMMINANPEMRRAFLSGNIDIVDDIFNRMIKPHVAQRLREKQARSAAVKNAPIAAPKGGSAAASAGEDKGVRPNLRTAQGRADFHKQAVARWIDKQSGDSE
jgi:hypothetical protein